MSSTPHPRRRGILAFLPDTLQHFPYHEEQWRDQKRQNRNKRMAKNKKISKNKNTIEDAIVCNTAKDTNQAFSNASTVVIFLMNPLQPLSLRYFHLLVDLLHNSKEETKEEQDTEENTCLVVVVNNSNSSSSSNNSIWQHAGCFTAPFSSMLQTACGFVACPALAVMETRHGRKISSVTEEWALDWNEPHVVLEAWRAGRSALSWKQQAMSKALAPTACHIM